MGFFDKFLKAIGFESEDEEYTSYNSEKKQKKESLTVSKFNLSKPEKQDRTKHTSFKGQEEQQLHIYSPSTEGEFEMLITKLEKGENALINLSGFSQENINRILDYLAGALFVLKCKIKKVEGNLYLINRYQGD